MPADKLPRDILYKSKMSTHEDMRIEIEFPSL